MIPAKSRERKCSTCRHYQPSPLWRKGWCRNPLLYDRNTNHLVEADSLACNRTFIDYWEPIEGPSPAATSGRTRPRIAPSVSLDAVDKQGNRGKVSENTPAMGNAVPPKQVLNLKATPRRSPFADLRVGDDLLDDEPADFDPKATQQIEEVEAPVAAPGRGPGRAVRSKRAAGGAAGVWTRPVPFIRTPLWLALALLAVVSALGGGVFLARQNLAVRPTPVPTVVQATVPPATPTGFGDATATPPPQPTTPPTKPPPPPPSNVIAVGGFVQVANSRTGLSVRDKPSVSGSKKLTVLPDGTKAHVVDGPVTADGYTWWKLDRFDSKNPATTGWSVSNFLTPIPAP